MERVQIKAKIKHQGVRKERRDFPCLVVKNQPSQPRCPLTDEWIKKIWYIYTMKYYSAIKRNETGPFVVMWMVLEYVIQNEVSQRKISYINAICEI